jgi:hypothetical protein
MTTLLIVGLTVIFVGLIGVGITAAGQLLLCLVGRR